jgi:integrase
MSRAKNKLSAAKVKSAGPGKLQDGGGLILDKTEAGGKWIYRYSLAGNRRQMGLGSYPDVSLASAREERDKWAAVLQSGLDPITERQRRIEAESEAANADEGPSLTELIDIVFESRKAQLRGEGERGRWMSPLKTHVIPKLGKRRAAKLTAIDIRDTLAPIWRKKPVTAQKAIRRLHIVFRQGKLAGLKVDPFTIESAKHLLGEVNVKETPIAATPWQEIPALFTKLGKRDLTSHLCLQLIILTAVRGDPARGARVEEIDGDVWTIPADRMKGKEGVVEDFRVPLSPAALEIVEKAKERAVDGFLFPARKHKGGYGPISATAIGKALNEIGEAGRPHGFRTSFRTWVQDTEAVSETVAETALAHVIGNKVRRAYARSDLLDRRRIAMLKWAEFVTGQEAKVIELKKG